MGFKTWLLAGSAAVSEWLLPPVVRLLEKSHAGRTSLRAYRRWTNPRHLDRPRVLCVGFQKTGTSSFGRAMKELGFSHFGYDHDLAAAAARGDIDSCLEFGANFDSLDDLPWSTPEFVAAFRARFPGSRYVFLDREEHQWLRSYFAYFNPGCSEAEALARLRGHQRRILEILDDEPHVLRMNICAGEGYEKLCPFLGVPIPQFPFPWENRAGGRSGS